MAKHPADLLRREALCAWLTANGINPEDVPQDADMTISEGTGGRFLCCEVFELDERGDTAARTVVAMPLKVEPPEWWQPYQKPTRDQLLATLERVRTLVDDGPPTGVAIAGEWEGGWDSAMEAVKALLDGEAGA